VRNGPVAIAQDVYRMFKNIMLRCQRLDKWMVNWPINWLIQWPKNLL